MRTAMVTSTVYCVIYTVHTQNGTSRPGGNCWNYNPGYLYLSQITGTHWKSDAYRFFLQVPDLTLSYSELTRMKGNQDSSLGNGQQGTCPIMCALCRVFSWHDDVIKWKHFPRYWPFVRRIHRSQRPVTRSFDVFFDLRLNKRLSKQLWGWWFETPSHPSWRHCNVLWRVNFTHIL